MRKIVSLLILYLFLYSNTLFALAIQSPFDQDSRERDLVVQTLFRYVLRDRTPDIAEEYFRKKIGGLERFFKKSECPGLPVRERRIVDCFDFKTNIAHEIKCISSDLKQNASIKEEIKADKFLKEKGHVKDVYWHFVRKPGESKIASFYLLPLIRKLLDSDFKVILYDQVFDLGLREDLNTTQLLTDSHRKDNYDKIITKDKLGLYQAVDFTSSRVVRVLENKFRLELKLPEESLSNLGGRANVEFKGRDIKVSRVVCGVANMFLVAGDVNMNEKNKKNMLVLKKLMEEKKLKGVCYHLFVEREFSSPGTIKQFALYGRKQGGPYRTSKQRYLSENKIEIIEYFIGANENINILEKINRHNVFKEYLWVGELWTCFVELYNKLEDRSGKFSPIYSSVMVLIDNFYLLDDYKYESFKREFLFLLDALIGSLRTTNKNRELLIELNNFRDKVNSVSLEDLVSDRDIMKAA
jgi:hypothetical protein